MPITTHRIRTTTRTTTRITLTLVIPYSPTPRLTMNSTSTGWDLSKNYAVCVIIQHRQTCNTKLTFAFEYKTSIFLILFLRESASKYLVPALEFCSTQDDFMLVFSYLRKYCFFSGNSLKTVAGSSVFSFYSCFPYS